MMNPISTSLPGLPARFPSLSSSPSASLELAVLALDCAIIDSVVFLLRPLSVCVHDFPSVVALMQAMDAGLVPDCLILTWTLFGRDDPELVSRLLLREPCPSIVVLVEGDEAETAQNTESAGMVLFVEMPAIGKALFEHVHGLLGAPKPQAVK